MVSVGSAESVGVDCSDVYGSSVLTVNEDPKKNRRKRNTPLLRIIEDIVVCGKCTAEMPMGQEQCIKCGETISFEPA